MKEVIGKIKKHLEKINNKEFINNLFIILIISIIILLVANTFLKTKNKEIDSLSEIVELQNPNYFEEDYSTYLEKKLINILSKINGVGNINVMVTLENSSEKIAATNTTTTTEQTLENDSEGGTREIIREDQTTQVMTKGNDDSLLVVKEIKPKVQGVIVVADGAEDPTLKEKLYEAVKTALGITGNKVQVYSSK